MSEPDADQKPAKRNAPLWVKIFVPLHIIAITAWSLPEPPSQYLGNPPAVSLKIETGTPRAFFTSSAEYVRNEFLIANHTYLKDSPIKLYLLTTGFWQYWDMFSPNPSSVDVYADAVVYYADGSTKKYQYPRMFEMSLGQKFLRERWRKFFERAGNDQYRYLWPVFGQCVALYNYEDPNNPPVKIDLHRHFMAIKPPGQPENREYTDEMYYTYFVNVDQLRKDKGF